MKDKDAENVGLKILVLIWAQAIPAAGNGAARTWAQNLQNL